MRVSLYPPSWGAILHLLGENRNTPLQKKGKKTQPPFQPGKRGEHKKSRKLGVAEGGFKEGTGCWVQ